MNPKLPKAEFAIVSQTTQSWICYRLPNYPELHEFAIISQTTQSWIYYRLPKPSKHRLKDL